MAVILSLLTMAVWSEVRTRAIDGRGIRAKDILDGKALRIVGRSKNMG
jgi:hypothetical protein